MSAIASENESENESKNPEITNNLKTIYDRINERISYLLIEKIKKVAIDALKKIKSAEEKKEEPVSIEPLKEAIINKLQDILPKEEDKEKEEDSQKSLIITFQNNSITLPDENVSIEPLKNAVINKLKQIIPDETKEEEVKDVKIEKTEGEPPRIPDFPGVYYYVFPGQGVWPDKNYPFSDSKKQTGGNSNEIEKLKNLYETKYKNYITNYKDLHTLNEDKKNVIQIFNMYFSTIYGTIYPKKMQTMRPNTGLQTNTVKIIPPSIIDNNTDKINVYIIK